MFAAFGNVRQARLKGGEAGDRGAFGEKGASANGRRKTIWQREGVSRCRREGKSRVGNNSGDQAGERRWALNSKR